MPNGKKGKKSYGWRALLAVVCAGCIWLQTAAGLTVQAQGNGEASQEEAAQALYAAQMAAYQQAQAEYAAQLAAYQQALLEQAQAQLEAQLAAQQAAQQQAMEQAQQALAQQQAMEQAQQQAAGQLSTGQLIAAGLLNNAPDSSLKGKTVSILGDSISTYAGYIPEGYACFYPDANNDVTDVTQTWWMQMLYNTGMRLLVNGSYSASAVCGDSRAENSSAGCSNRRVTDLMGADGSVPDVILVYMGANDFFHSIELGTYSEVATHRTDHFVWNFTEGYELMLQKLQAVYPTSRIYCMTLIESNSGDHPRVNENGNTIADYNRRIKEIAAAHGLPVIDVHNCGIEVYELNQYTSDGTHPNKAGAQKMATYVTNALLAGG